MDSEGDKNVCCLLYFNPKLVFFTISSLNSSQLTTFSLFYFVRNNNTFHLIPKFLLKHDKTDDKPNSFVERNRVFSKKRSGSDARYSSYYYTYDWKGVDE